MISDKHDIKFIIDQIFFISWKYFLHLSSSLHARRMWWMVSSEYWLYWWVSGHILTGLGDYWTKLRHSGTRVIKYTANQHLNTAQQHVTFYLLISFYFTKLCPSLPSLYFLDPGLKLPPAPVDIVRYCESPVQRVGRVIGLPCPHNLTTSAHHRPADLRYFEASYELTWWITPLLAVGCR